MIRMLPGKVHQTDLLSRLVPGARLLKNLQTPTCSVVAESLPLTFSEKDILSSQDSEEKRA